MSNIKKMLTGMVIVSSVMSNAMSVKERARMFESPQSADQREMKQVGKLQNELGYVSKAGPVYSDFARQRALNRIRPVVESIESREGIDTAQDIVNFVARNKQRNERGESELRPMAAHRPHVVVLENQLAGLSLEEQIEVLGIVQNELAMGLGSN